jgi:ferredoxin
LFDNSINKCGGCGVCCKACHVEAISKPAGVLCWLYEEGKGCSEYSTRPDDCRTYQCVWITQDNIDLKFRPDKLGVIFEQPFGCSFWMGIELEEGALQKEDTARLVRAINHDGAPGILKNMAGKLQFSLPPGMTFETLNAMYSNGMQKIREKVQ